MMKRQILCLLMISSIGIQGIAQSTKSTGFTPSDISVSFGFGLSEVNLRNFNDMARINNFPVFEEGILPSFYFGFKFIDPDSKWFGDINTTYSFGSVVKNGYKATHNSTNIDLNVNYYLYQKGALSIAPSLGLGVLMHGVAFNEDFSQRSFGNTMQHITGERNYYSNANIYLNPKVSLDYKLGNGMYGIGWMIGYRLGLNHPKWRIADGQKLKDAPTSTASGFYTGISINLN